MSGLSSPASLLTVHASNTSIQILSILKIGSGVAAFIAPAFFANRAFKFQAAKQDRTVGATATIGRNTTTPGSESEQSIAVRMYGARDIALGLLLRDSTAAVVTRALQVSVIADILDLVAAGAGVIEGNLSTEVATGVAGVAAAFAAFQLWILNRSVV